MKPMIIPSVRVRVDAWFRYIDSLPLPDAVEEMARVKREEPQFSRQMHQVLDEKLRINKARARLCFWRRRFK